MRRARAGGIPGSVLKPQSADGGARHLGRSRSNFGSQKLPPNSKPGSRPLMDTVRLPRERVNRRPHEFSGGSAPAICICPGAWRRNPNDVCDEAVSAARLVSVKARRQPDAGPRSSSRLASLHQPRSGDVRAHDARVAVMYFGKIVERAGRAAHLHRAEAFPITRALRGGCRSRAGARAIDHHQWAEVPRPINPPERMPLSHQLSMCSHRLPDRPRSRRATKRRRSVGGRVISKPCTKAGPFGDSR